MRFGPKALLLALALLAAVLIAQLVARTQGTLRQIDDDQESEALTLARTVAGAVRGIVRFGPDREGRMQAALEEVAAEPGVTSIALLTEDGAPIVRLGDSGVDRPTGALPAMSRAGDRLAVRVPFDIDQPCLCEGCPGCHPDNARIGPGRYELVLGLDGSDAEQLRSHVRSEAIGLGVILLLLIVVAALLSRSLRRQQGLALRVATEQQKRESLESLRLVAAGLAHEIRNPLGAIRGYAQLAHERAETEEAREQTAIMLEELDRVAERLEEFLSFAGRRRPKREPVDLAALADSVVALLQPDADSLGVQLRREGASTARVSADPSQLKELLTNLALNALQACEPEASVTMTVREDGANGVIEVADEGGGISQGDRPRVFEPYFSTRAGGTGLGLAISRRIAEGHEGTLHLFPRPEGGTLARLVLPAGTGET